MRVVIDSYTLAGLLAALLLCRDAGAAPRDSDGDGIANRQDNCSLTANPSQQDGDLDGFGSACDPDEGFVPGPSGLGCAGRVPCTCEPPQLASLEEVLSGDVEITWSARAGSGFEVERQKRSGPWEPLAFVEAGETSFVDASAQSGTYRYRLRSNCAAPNAGEQWSVPTLALTAQLAEECEGQRPMNERLATVEVDDRDRDGRYTGNDIALALERCSLLGGCVLEALPVAYDDVAILIGNGHPWACLPTNLNCFGPELTFPRGLVIQGHGTRTSFRSPLWAQPYEHPAPVLRVWGRPDIRIRLRNLVLDGRKQQQSDPSTSQDQWWHYGFESWHEWDTTSRNSEGCIHNLTVRNLMMRGISLLNTRGWIVEQSTIEDIGCWDGLTPCPRLWRTPQFGAAGYRSDGYGISIGKFNEDLTLRDNLVRRAAKYAIGLKGGALGAGALQRPVVVRNRIVDTGFIGIFVSGTQDARIRDNRVESTHAPGEWDPTSYSSWGIRASGFVDHSVFHANEVLESAGSGFGWSAEGNENVISSNTIEGSCREKNPSTHYNYADIEIKNKGGSLQLTKNFVAESSCARPYEFGR
jgi:hypothetical protein